MIQKIIANPLPYAALAFALFLTATQSFFTVDQRTQAIVLQLGNPVGEAGKPETYIKGPGIHLKIPFIQSVLFFDRRVLPVDPDPEQVVISSAQVGRIDAAKAAAEAAKSEPAGPDKSEAEASPGPVIENVSGEPIIVDTFARYRIVDPLQFLKTLRTTTNAAARLKNILNDATRAELGRTTLQELLSAERTAIMTEIKERVNRTIAGDSLGIEIVDVRIVRADLTPELRTSTVRRMISQLTERATETRSKGEERALEIRSNAERERSIIIADAQRDSEIIKGQGDNQAITIYSESLGKDREFYAFFRSLQAYRETLAGQDTQIIMAPGSGFFRYLNAPRPAPAAE